LERVKAFLLSVHRQMKDAMNLDTQLLLMHLPQGVEQNMDGSYRSDSWGP
jgi:hypothetical protein